jgi:hypothetical protein
MMEPNPSRAARKVAIADHLWEAFEQMAAQMGTDRDGLINQAMFTFGRQNGFFGGNGHGGAGESAQAPVAVAVPTPMSQKSKGSLASVPAPRSQSRSPADEDPARREVAERVLETAAELERLIKGKGSEVSREQDAENIPEADSGVIEDVPQESDGLDQPSEGPALFLVAEGGETDRIVKERFVIGRGKHCDFVINSGKVSREHAVISHEGGDYFIEDLGSSNGTWFNKQRIKRRKIEDGDEYYICSEKIKLVMR